MKSYTNNNHEKSKRGTGSSSKPHQCEGATFQLFDNRTTAIAQQQLVEAINTSPKQTAQRQQLNTLFGNAAQLQSTGEDEIQLKTDFSVVQRMGQEKDELLQGQFETVQRQGRLEEEKLLQGKYETAKSSEPQPGNGSIETIQLQTNAPIQFGKKKLTPKQEENRRHLLEKQERKLKERIDRRKRVDEINVFMETQVAPWATQARISQILGEDFEDIKNDKSLTQDVTMADFSKNRVDSEDSGKVIPKGAVFPAPSKSKVDDDQKDSGINRGLPEMEVVNKKIYVRIYSTMFAEETPDKKGKTKYKDVHQDEKSGKVTVHTGTKDEGTGKVMWISAGRPLRQVKWMYKYQVQDKNAKPVIRSFLVPIENFNQISANAVNEEVASKKGNEQKSFNVDTAYEPNQFGVRGSDIDLLRKGALDKSLISYSDKPDSLSKKYGGDIQGIEVLKDKLGTPTDEPPKPIWVDEETGSFVKTSKHKKNADDLMMAYGLWKNNDEFIPERFKKIPKQRRMELLRKFLGQQGFKLPYDWLPGVTY